MRLKPIEKTAYHEAGHVVSYYLMGFTVKSATIVRNDSTYGQTIVTLFDENLFAEDFRLDRIADYELVFRSIVGGIAGSISEYIGCGRLNLAGSNRDFDEIDELLEKLHLSKELVEGICATAAAYIRDILNLDKNWNAVERIAGSLLEKNS